MLDLAQNMNALGPPPNAKELLSANLDALFEYPHPQDNEVRRVIAQWLDVEVDCVAVGNGATEIIFSLPNVLQKKQNIILSPTFWQYQNSLEKSEQWNVQKFSLNKHDFSFNPDALRKQLQENARYTAVYLCNPNNPTSTLIQRDVLLDLANEYKDAFFIIDETYLLFSKDYNEQSMVKAAASEKNIAVLTSLSKFYHLPGIRVGAIVSAPHNINEFLRKKIPYMSNPMIPVVLQELICDKDFINRTRLFYCEQRMKIFNLLNENFYGELEAYKPSTIFTLVHLLTDQTSEEICSFLSNNEIIVRSGKYLPDLGEKWIRIATTQDKNISKLIEVLKQCVGNSLSK